MTANDLITGFSALLQDNTTGDIEASAHLARVIELIQSKVNKEDDTFDAYGILDATKDSLELDTNFLPSGLMKSAVQAALSADQRQVGQLHVHRTKNWIVYECTWNGNWRRINTDKSELKTAASWDGSAWSATAGSPFLTPSVSGSSLIVLYNNPDDLNFISNVVESAVVSSDETLITNGYLINFSATTSRVTIIFYKDGAQITDLSTLPAGIELNIKVNFQRP